MSKRDWPYEAYAPLPAVAGDFNIWIIGIEKNHLSGCNWETRRTASGFLFDAPRPVLTKRTVSKQWRAYLAAAVGAIERLPANSRAIICSHNPTLLDLISNIDAYRANKWRKADGTTLAEIDILIRLIAARDGDQANPRNIVLSTRLADTDEDILIINSLRDDVRAALDARIRGVPPDHAGI